MKQHHYFTSTLAYINAEPHISFAREVVEADVFKRIYKLWGGEVFLNTGTDEHGAKIAEKAQEIRKTPQEYADKQVKSFLKFCELFAIDYDQFIRTTDKNHEKSAQEFWKICDKNGFIYQKKYKTKYCVGCELEKTDSELVKGECPDHPGKPLEIIEEENYFFKFSAFQEKLLNFYEQNPDFVKPKKRFNEIKSFVKSGLVDFSISRLKEKMPWGIEVPGDSKQVMYVWFDALVNYISTIGWSEDKKEFEKWWGAKEENSAIQFCGKDNLRQQAAMWQAMLMSVNLPNSKRIYVNGFITVAGQKMSKTIGNVISPFEMAERYGAEATRYLLLAIGSFGEDTDITWEKMDEKYNADLANGIGNLTSRVITLYQKIEEKFDFASDFDESFFGEKNKKETANDLGNGRLENILKRIIAQVQRMDSFLEKEKPWELIKTDQAKFVVILKKLTQELNILAQNLQPFMPEVAKQIKKSLQEKQKINLFPRK